MSAQALSSRAVMGMYYAALEAQSGMGWVDGVSNYFTSDQDSETYPFLNQVPQLREWVGGRNAKGFTSNEIDVKNLHYESTIEILLKDLRRDKTGQLQARIGEFAERPTSHFASLLSTLIINGESTACYDGQYYFDTDHSEGSSGSQSNDITTDISALATEGDSHGSVTAPSPGEMQQAILKSIAQMYTLVDDQGEPINENASEFLVMVPVGLQPATQAALTTVRAASSQTFDMENIRIRAAVNPRLTAGGWTDQFVTFRTDGNIKALIRQEETTPDVKLKDEESEYAFDNDAIQVGVDTWRNVAYGRWQYAVLNALT